MAADGATPALVSIHSYTPQLRGRAPRPWQVGILWHHDGRIARPLIARLRAEGLRVGDNEPYSGELEGDTMSRHGTGRGLPHVLIEIRQDLIGTPADQRLWAGAARPHLEPGDRGDSRWMTPPGPSSRPPRSARCATTCANATDVQNIDLMNLAGFCRNCLSRWYQEAAEARGVAMDKDEAREIVYGMPYAEWIGRHQTEADPAARAAFAARAKP